uniref:Uncharacterized protein n=1 Tax=Mesocestoides corti TaxID=53468 RepID=A0A5K3FFI8_MESCO
MNAMPKQSYNLPRLTAFANKVAAVDSEEHEEVGTVETPRLVATEVVSSEPLSADADVDEENSHHEERDWSHDLCECCLNKSHCELGSVYA